MTMTHAELLALIDQAADEGWTELDLSGQGLTELPSEIGKLTQLEMLFLGKINDKKWTAGKYTPILATNQLKNLPSEFAMLTNLRVLDLSGNPFQEIPNFIFRLQALEFLALQALGLSEIPKAITQLQNLQQLSLAENQIREIPDSVAQLKNLQRLELDRNQIREIPDSIAQLKSLRQLYLGQNQICEIPDSFAQLQNLQQLSCSNNQLSKIPDAVIQLQNLQQLSLWNNPISKIPEAIIQLQNLQQLYLWGNQICEVPDAIAQLQNLQQLYLGQNQISEIPNTIFELKNLQELYLWGSSIKEIPEAITQLQNLRELGLWKNQIREIPNVIAQLQKLERLELDSNQITEVPDWLELLPNLKKLDLRQNPLPISPEVLGPANLKEDPGSIEGVFNYLRQLRSGTVRPLNEAKVLVVGQGGVGKTSLVNRLMENRFDRQEAQTDGLMVRTWMVSVNSKDVRLNVWDFGGQEIYHATHQFFLTKRSLYLLVCNCRTSEEENRLEYWLKLIQSFGGESPVIIVGNKSDEQPLDINRKALRTKYPNIKAILETSCQTREGIEALKSAILQEVGDMNDVYNLLPLSWFEVKEQLERMDRDFISYSEYLGICFQNSVHEEQNQDQLIDLLHRLGLVLNFRNHPILQNTSVLNPDWVTEGIYALLSDESLKTEQKGILTHADLSRVLDPQRYPSDRHHFLTQLMQEFQLCFALPHCTTPRFLIPGLLPKEEPEDISLAGDTLDFQYHYRILPESILSRFIVLSHEKIHNHTHWRSGVMLAYTESNEICNLARVRADFEDKKIFIAISGRETTRRIFLSILRDTFTTIHNSFGNLEVSEWVPVPDYPDHPPLDYQELLGQEAMGEQSYAIGKLRIRVDLRQLLDGYESAEARQRRQLKENGIDIEEVMEGMRPSLRVNIHQTNSDDRSRTLHQHGTGDNVAGDSITGDKIVGES